MNNKKSTNNTDLYNKAYRRLKIVGHPLRNRIMDFIRSKHEVNVTTIYRSLDLEQSVASQHLALLRNAKAVNRRREGKELMYSVNEDALQYYATLSEQVMTY